MKLNFTFNIIIVLLCFERINCSDIEEQQKKVVAYLNDIEPEFLRQTNLQYEAEWAFASNITDENEINKNNVAAEVAKFLRDVSKKVQEYNWREFNDPDLRRKCEKLARLGLAVLPESDYKDAIDNISKMESFYGKAKACSYLDRTKCDLSLEPDIENVFRKSRNPDELKHYWTEWYNNFSKLKPNYIKYVEYGKQAAKLNNLTSNAEEWLYDYEDSTIEQQLQDILADLKPLYDNLHAYVRHRLQQFYGDKIVSSKGPIPMHLCGNLWCQTLSEISDIISPFPNKTIIDVTEEMKRQNYTAIKMFQMGDEFFTSLNMTKLPQEFWDKSILEKPTDGRELICHASAWDFYKKNDVRIKQCTLVTNEQFSVVHHELGHVQYFLQYQYLSYPYRTGANPGFHEAVGDTIALSVMTPKHLEKVGLLKDYKPDEETRLNNLFITAVDKVFFLPFAFTMDKYRWGVFRGEIKPDEYNCAFWKLREQYSGVEPPVQRSEENFDAPAKYHIAADVEYLRYLVSFIIQFQFYKAACIKADQYQYGNPQLPLDNCDFYGNTNAGNSFKAMLSAGASKPWPDAMEVLTGERIMSSKAIREYFEPLEKWLIEYNQKNDIYVGWEPSNKCS